MKLDDSATCSIDLGIHLPGQCLRFRCHTELRSLDEQSVKGKFFGNREKRGLYRTADGTAINADINGALNIARKELGDEWLKSQLKANGGRMNRPVSVRNIGLTLKEGLRSLETASVRAR